MEEGAGRYGFMQSPPLSSCAATGLNYVDGGGGKGKALLTEERWIVVIFFSHRHFDRYEVLGLIFYGAKGCVDIKSSIMKVIVVVC